MQKVFDIDNEEDMKLLWDILPDETIKARKVKTGIEFLDKDNEPCLYIHDGDGGVSIIKINWHDKTEITRPIQEVTEQDIGKICMFFNSLSNSKYYGVLIELRETVAGTRYVAQSCNGTHPFIHAYRLTKQEIEELC